MFTIKVNDANTPVPHIMNNNLGKVYPVKYDSKLCIVNARKIDCDKTRIAEVITKINSLSLNVINKKNLFKLAIKDKKHIINTDIKQNSITIHAYDL
jgi:hypothetical protein